jgi:hypothetical protein
MTSMRKNKRPYCSEILASTGAFVYTLEDLKDDKNFLEIVKSNDVEPVFCKLFIETKYNELLNRN